MFAIEMLEDEHKLIVRVVEMLPLIQQKVEKGDVDPEVLLAFVDFFQVYVGKSHHVKEEEVLFPLLVKRGVPLNGCPISDLRNEHDQGRMHMRALGEAVRRYIDGVSDAKQIADYLRHAADFYKGHIWKEDFLLFSMSRKVFNDSDQDELLKEFMSVDSKLGHHFQEEYHYRVSRLESILKGDGKITHPWSPHNRLEEPTHLIHRLEEILRA